MSDRKVATRKQVALKLKTLLANRGIEVTLDTSEAIVKDFHQLVLELLAEGQDFQINNVGRISVFEIAESKRMVTMLNRECVIPASKRVRFVSFRALRERLNAS